MITLHVVPSDKKSKELEQRLEDLVVAFKKNEHEEGEIDQGYIEEDGKIYKSSDEIKEWFRELSSDLDWQRSLSGDGCYIDPKDGKVC